MKKTNINKESQHYEFEFKPVSIVIGCVKYKDIEYPLYLSKLKGINDIAYNIGKPNKYIEVNIDWIKELSYIRPDSLWHVIGHLYHNTYNEYIADKFVCERVGFEGFMRIIDDMFMKSLSKLRYRKEKLIYRSYCDYRILAMSNIENFIDESYQLTFKEEYNNLEKIQEIWDKNFK